MAKKSVVARQAKRERLVAKYAQRRAEYRRASVDMTLTQAERMDARRKLHALPRDSAPCRLRTRCAITGRPRAVYRQFGLARGKLREYAMEGMVPGLTKASW